MDKKEAAQILEVDAARLTVKLMAMSSKRKLFEYELPYLEALETRIEALNKAITLLEESAEEERWR